MKNNVRKCKITSQILFQSINIVNVPLLEQVILIKDVFQLIDSSVLPR